MRVIRLIFFIVCFIFYPSIAFSYLGPGMAGGIVIATLGIIIAIFVGLFGVIWFPIRKYLLKIKKKKKKENDPY